MPSKRIEGALRRLLGPRSAVPEPTPQLEAELLADFDRRYPQRSGAGGFGLLSFARMHRFALASVLFLIGTIGACYAPAEVEVPLGVTVEFTSQGEDHEQVVREMIEYVRESTGATEIGVEAYKKDDGPLMIRLRVWGDVPTEGLDEELLEVFPHLEEADLSAVQMEGTVETTLGRRLGHQLRLVALAEDDVEDARAALLLEIAAQGIEGTVDISIDEQNGHKEIRIEVQKELDGEEPQPSEGTKRIKMRVIDDGHHVEEDVDVRHEINR